MKKVVLAPLALLCIASSCEVGNGALVDSVSLLVEQYSNSELPHVPSDFAIVLYSDGACVDSCFLLTAASIPVLCQEFPKCIIAGNVVFVDTNSVSQLLVDALRKQSAFIDCRSEKEPFVDTRIIVDAPVWHLIENDGIVRRKD